MGTMKLTEICRMEESDAANQKSLGKKWCKISAMVCAVILVAVTIVLGVVLTLPVEGEGTETVPPNQPSRLNDWGLQGALNCDMPAANKGRYRVVVIGAGVSGLSAAHQLMRRGICDVLVVEALDRMGGRVKQIEGIAPWPLEGGAELIHGEDSIVRKLTQSDQKGVEIPAKAADVVNYVFWADTEELVSLEEGVPELERVNSIFSAAYDVDYYDGDTELSSTPTMLDVLEAGGVTESNVRSLDVAEASIANEYGADLKTISAVEIVWAGKNYLDGGQDFAKEGTFKPLVDWLAEDIPIRLGWPVVKVDWEADSGAWVIGADRQSVRADAVVTAVPLTQLKNKAIQFSPPLPKNFNDMVDKITINNAVKVFAYFKDSFWKNSIHADKFGEEGNFQGMYSPGTNFPQAWVSSNPNHSNSSHQHSEHTVFTAFVHNGYADVLSGLGEEEAVKEFVELLDRVFKRAGSANQAQQVGLATESFLKGGMMDWSQEPYIEAGYSSPSIGIGPGERQVLSSVDGGVLFFAGEHTNVYVNQALQGSMETGRRAAQDVAAVLKDREF